MRIGIDASRAFVEHPTGTERYSFEVITRMLRLSEAREHTWVFYTKPTNFQFSIFNFQSMNKSQNIQVHNIPFKYLWTQAGLAYRTWVDKLDVLWVPAHTLPVFRKPGIKSIVTIHGIEYEWLPAYENRLQRWYLPLSTKYAVLSAESIIAVSEFTKKQLVERLGADLNKIQVVYEGFDPQILNSKFEIPNKSQILNKYKITSKQYVLFVGTVQPRKNLERLIEAFANLSHNSSPNNPLKYLTPNPSPNLGEGNRRGEMPLHLKLVIVGKLGWLYENIISAPKKYGVEDRVIFIGYADDPTRQVLLDNALVYVQPSITEGFGLPVLEAMEAGIPVVSSMGGALTEIVGNAGVLFDPLDVNGMVSSLQLVVDSQQKRNELVEKGRERVKDFGWEKTAIETLRLITNDH